MDLSSQTLCCYISVSLLVLAFYCYPSKLPQIWHLKTKLPYLAVLEVRGLGPVWLSWLCFVFSKVGLKVLAGLHSSWRLWAWIHFQAHSCPWQNVVLCTCKSEVPDSLLATGQGHSQLLEATSVPFSPSLKPATVVWVLVTLSISLTSSSDSSLFCLQPEKILSGVSFCGLR